MNVFIIIISIMTSAIIIIIIIITITSTIIIITITIIIIIHTLTAWLPGCLAASLPACLAASLYFRVHACVISRYAARYADPRSAGFLQGPNHNIITPCNESIMSSALGQTI